MVNFDVQYWDEKVKDQAIKAKGLCTEGYTKHYIGQMIFNVDHAIMHGNLAKAYLQSRAVADVLNKDHFYKEVYGSIETEEIKELKKLGKMLADL